MTIYSKQIFDVVFYWWCCCCRQKVWQTLLQIHVNFSVLWSSTPSSLHIFTHFAVYSIFVFHFSPSDFFFILSFLLCLSHYHWILSLTFTKQRTYTMIWVELSWIAIDIDICACNFFLLLLLLLIFVWHLILCLCVCVRACMCIVYLHLCLRLRIQNQIGGLSVHWLATISTLCEYDRVENEWSSNSNKGNSSKNKNKIKFFSFYSVKVNMNMKNITNFAVNKFNSNAYAHISKFVTFIWAYIAHIF